MAKKKGTRHSHPHPQSLDLTQHHPTVQDDPSVLQIQNLKKLNSILLMEIQNLKKLNSVLLKETTQGRKSLLQAGDTNLALEVENAVLVAFIETQTREMGFRFDEVVGERNERGYEVAALKNERGQLKDELVAGEKRLMEAEDRERMVIEMLKVETEGVMREKNEIEKQQNEIVELQGVVDKTKESCREFEEKNKQLLSQVKHYKDYVDQVMLEKDSIRKGFDEEKNKVEKLELQVAGIEDDMKQQVVSLQKSVAKAHKSKSLWTLISSGTTILATAAAAAFAAYVARGRR